MINGLSIGGGQQVAQVTPTGAAIKLHFAYNNSNINGSSSTTNNKNIYSGLKTVEQNMNNNNNNKKTGEVLKMIKIREKSEAIVPTGGIQELGSFSGLSAAAGSYAGSDTSLAAGLIQGTGGSIGYAIGLSPASGSSVASGEPRITVISRGPCRAKDSASPTELSPGLIAGAAGEGTSGIAQGSGTFMNCQVVAPGTSISQLFKNSASVSPLLGVPIGSGALRAVYKVADPAMSVRKRPANSICSAGAPSGVAAVRKVSQIGASGLRWLPMPRPKENQSNAGGTEIKALDRGAEAPGSPGEAAKSALVNPQPQRTEDQENAFRRIEDVHNYAKLQDYSSDTEEEEDDDEELDEEGEDEEEEQEIQVELPVQQEITRIRREADEEHVDVDVVTVPQLDQDRHQVQPQQLQEDQPADNIRPEHHARRPMNAFLIFCKRHRGIVKERYKTLENR